MAGHSQFKNIMHRKGAQDAKRAKLFTKVIREITVAIKQGSPDPGSNPRLRAALSLARANNMPRDNIERAIKKASGEDDGVVYEEVRYEGYGPGGVAVIVDALTDNRNRTASDVRSTFTKHGGNLGETNSVGFMFNRVGYIHFPPEKASADVMFEVALEAGAENVESDQNGHEITCTIDDFSTVRDALEEKFGPPAEAKLMWKPATTVPVNEETAQTLFKMIDILEDLDDVQNVSTNFEVSEEVLAKLSA